MLGARIAALRRNQGMSQAELARRLQISPSAVGMYEQGRREPSAALLVSIAEQFGVSTDYLLTGQPRAMEGETIQNLLAAKLDAAERMLHRRGHPLTRNELAALLAAVLMEP